MKRFMLCIALHVLELLGSDMGLCTVYAKVRLGNADIKMRSPSRTFLYNGTQVLLFHASGACFDQSLKYR